MKIKRDAQEAFGSSYDETRKPQPQKKSSEVNSFLGCLSLFIKDPKTISILENRGIKELFPIQRETFLYIKEGTDVVARDRTGSGKTLAYALPIVQRCRQEKIFNGRHKIKMLVVLPTRELAVQVASEMETLKHSQDEFKVALAYGGEKWGQQASYISQGVDFLVATPGRLLDFIEKGVVEFSSLDVLCLDEADEMLKQGFKEQVDKILKVIKEQAKAKVQILLFSATLPSWINEIIQKYLEPKHRVCNMIQSQENSCSKTIKHYKIQVEKRDKLSTVLSLLNQLEKQAKCIIFCETKRETTLLQDQLSSRMSEPVRALNGDVSQDKRLMTFDMIKNGKLRFLVATNVAARGLDIPNIELIVQFTPPRDTETYIHRAGRTGRAGKSGTCILLYGFDEEHLLGKICSQAQIAFEPYSFKPKAKFETSTPASKEPVNKYAQEARTDLRRKTESNFMKDEDFARGYNKVRSSYSFDRPQTEVNLKSMNDKKRIQELDY